MSTRIARLYCPSRAFPPSCGCDRCAQCERSDGRGSSVTCRAPPAPSLRAYHRRRFTFTSVRGALVPPDGSGRSPSSEEAGEPAAQPAHADVERSPAAPAAGSPGRATAPSQCPSAGRCRRAPPGTQRLRGRASPGTQRGSGPALPGDRFRPGPGPHRAGHPAAGGGLPRRRASQARLAAAHRAGPARRAGWLATGGEHYAVRAAVSPTALLLIIAAAVGLAVVWSLVIIAGYRMLAPDTTTRAQHMVGGALVVLLALGVSAPAFEAAHLASVQRNLVSGLFGGDVESATVPDGAAASPWGDKDRVNILLLGGDGGDGREGIRTDTVIVASIDTETGATSTFIMSRYLD